MASFNNLNRFFDRLDKDFLHGVVPHIIAEKATEYYKRCFTVKADVNNKAWPIAKNPPSRGSLMVRSGNLMASIRPSVVNSNRVVISAGSARVPYAKIHNEGGEVGIPVTKDMRKFAWAMNYKTGDERWKGLALTRKSVIRVNVPKRQFMGHSKILNQIIVNTIKTAFKALF